jgi:hypothetical protein
MNAREVDAWYMRGVVHACVVAVLLVLAMSIGVIARLDESSRLPRDRPPAASLVQISEGQDPVPATPFDASSPSGQAQGAGK